MESIKAKLGEAVIRLFIACLNIKNLGLAGYLNIRRISLSFRQSRKNNSWR